MSPVSGLINLYKPAGISSAQAVRRACRPLGSGVRAGHAGTLDTEASGILPLCVGRATRCADFFLEYPKQYVAELTFGFATDTGDVWGETVERCDGAWTVSPQALEAVLPSFIGEISQVPPAYAALKIGGVPAYRLARKGNAPDMQARTVRIYGITLRSFCWPKAVLSVWCGRGTYIRALCRDIGQALGGSAVMSALERRCYGPFGSADAVTVETIEAVAAEAAATGADVGTLLRTRGVLQPPDRVLGHLPVCILQAEPQRRYRMGQRVEACGPGVEIRPTPGDTMQFCEAEIRARCAPPPAQTARLCVYGADGGLIGVAERTEAGLLRPVRCLADGGL